MSHFLSRRTFLQSCAAVVGGAVLTGCETDPTGPAESPGRLPSATRSLSVAVIGAGISGLTAAYELKRAGHRVTVIEARDRVGGRILTLRSPFASGQSAEAGAARIPPDHNLTLGYADHLGLALDPFYPRGGTYMLGTGGHVTLQDADGFRRQRPDYRKLRGGTDALPAALADRLAGDILLGAAVVDVQQYPDRCDVVTDRDGTVSVDRVLCAVPLTVLNRIEFTPPLSGQKREAMDGGFAYEDATRVFLRTSSRFWEGEGRNGWGVSDWPEEIWHPSWDVTGVEGVLLSYQRGNRARDLDALSHEARAAELVQRWEAYLPGLGSAVVGTASHSWALEPWSRGAWASPSAEGLEAFGPFVARQEGRVHFCGEHDSGAFGWMQGALSSALRVSAEISAAA